MTFSPISQGGPYRGGHYHGNFLGITLWGAGMELLPDAGYVTSQAAYRYPNQDVVFHNAGWVTSQNMDYTGDNTNKYTRPSLLAYDPGDVSDKQVQLLEASEPGPVEDLVDIKRRLLMMVKIDGNRSYVLDLQRMKGGDAHENFLRASEEEDCDLSTSLELEEHGGTLADYLKSNPIGLNTYRSYMSEPRSAEGDEAFDFTWKGQQSGSSLHVFMNGIENSEVYFSRIPTARRAGNKAELRDNYPGWHFYRRRLVNDTDITRYGAVYESYRDTQTALVKNVKWMDAEPYDSQSIVCVVETEEYEDTIYISNDNVKRSANGYDFSGTTCMVRKNKDSQTAEWGYIYGEGQIVGNGIEVTGEEDKKFRILSVSDSIKDGEKNEIKIEGSLSGNTSLNGVWARTIFGDKSGWGLKIKSIDQNTIETEQHPAFEITEEGAKMLFFPAKSLNGILTAAIGGDVTPLSEYEDVVIKGQPWLEIKTPTFVTKFR